ncbi:MAG: sulfite exporter TauE/SafE family protein [Candidatus Shapirobacteria bacterium]|jgi:sulfite exporter TauE/SafE
MSSQGDCCHSNTPSKPANLINSFIIVGIILTTVYFLSQTSLFSLFSVTPDSLPLAFFPFGLLAGFSTCAGLIGGIALSLSHHRFSFNTGRLTSFFLLGGLLGFLGQSIRLSFTLGSILTIIVSLAMILFGLQILGLRVIRLSFSPQSLTKNSFLIGALTFFLPCGFTLTSQSLALASGSFVTGALIMGFFALGTAIPLFLIGYSGSKFSSKPSVSQVVGLLVIAFAFFNLSSQLKVLGFSPQINLGSNIQNLGSNKGLPPIVNGVQVLKMSASSRGYSPSRLKVRANVPVRWEITDTGTGGCTNAVIARQLFDGPVNLVPGTTSVREFSVTKPGVYNFSCWMGMVSGTLEAI